MNAPKKETTVDSSKDFFINSYGGCSRSYLEIIYPKKISFNELLTMSNKTRTLTTDIAEFMIESNDSKKNWHRKITIKPKVAILVHKWGQGSCNPNSTFNEVWLLTLNNEPAQLEMKDEIRERDDGKYHIKEIIRYVEFDNKRFDIMSEILDKQIIESKIEITISVMPNKVIISGDTYNLRDIIKALKFRWDGASRTWQRNGSDYDDIQIELEQRGIKVNIKEVAEQ